MTVLRCCDTFCDNGPRFLIISILSAIIHCTCCIVIFLVEKMPWSLYFGIYMAAGVVVCSSVLHTGWRNRRQCGDMLGITACLHFAHFFSSGLLESSKYTNGYKVHTAVSTSQFLAIAFVMTWLALWHKKVVCPRNRDDPSHIDNQQNPNRFKVLKYCLGPMASFVYGVAESRFAAAVAPAEALVGICTSCLMFALYNRKYRLSALGSLVSLIWMVFSMLLVVVACILHTVKPKTETEKYQHKISIFICLCYATFFTAAVAFKFFLLREPLNLNFSTQPETSVVVSPSRNLKDLEAQPYGLAHVDGEKIARKLQLHDGFETCPKRTSTDVTDVSITNH